MTYKQTTYMHTSRTRPPRWAAVQAKGPEREDKQIVRTMYVMNDCTLNFFFFFFFIPHNKSYHLIKSVNLNKNSGYCFILPLALKK